jgi:hypothetical protein
MVRTAEIDDRLVRDRPASRQLRVSDMTPFQIAILLALTIYAIYRQSIRHQIFGHARFKLAAISGAVGLLAGGFAVPPDRWAWMDLATGILVSAAVSGAAAS